MVTRPLDFRTEAKLARLRPAFVEWLGRWPWTHFVTLATNDHRQTISPDSMRRRLRYWDAMMNRELLGPKWTQRPRERLFAAYFLEKHVVNPHWHGLVILKHPDPMGRLEQANTLKSVGDFRWKQLSPGGTVDVQFITFAEGATKYVTKAIGNLVQYEYFVAPRSFDPTFP